MMMENKQENFIRKSQLVHGDKYDYTETHYVKSNVLVTITCKQCGRQFNILPLNHLHGVGCSICGHKKSGASRAMSTEQFIEKSKDIHGDRYDYSQVRYVNRHTPIKLICRKHGEFEIVAGSHLDGHGCKCCGIESRIKKMREQSK